MSTSSKTILTCVVLTTGNAHATAIMEARATISFDKCIMKDLKIWWAIGVCDEKDSEGCLGFYRKQNARLDMDQEYCLVI